jgi:hypothetical protein
VVATSKRFLVALLLEMTEKGVSLEMTPFFRVIPSVSEGSAVGNKSGSGGNLEEIPRRVAPRNDRKG